MMVNRERVRTYLTRAALALGAGLVFLAPFPAGCHEQSHWAVMAMLAILLGAVALVARGLGERALLQGARRRVDPVLVALGALAGLMLFQLVPLPSGLVGLVSPARLRLAREVAEVTGGDPDAWLPLTTCLKCTRDSLLLFVAYISVFYAASMALVTGERRRLAVKILMGALVAGASVLAFRGFGQVLQSWGTRLTSTFSNPNRFAALMAMAGACAVGMFVAERSRRRGDGERLGGELRFPRGTIWLVAAVVVEIALVLTLSRLGIASALVAGLVAIALFTGKRSVWAALAGLLVLLAISAALAASPVLARYSILFEQELGGAGGRNACWRMAWPAAAGFPVFGSGAGTFGHVFRAYQGPSLPGFYRHAHNDLLELFTDTGLLGFVATAAAVVFAVKGMLPLRRSRRPETRGVAVAALLGLGAVLLHSAADFPLQEPAVALAFSALAGVAYGTGLRRSADEGAREEKSLLPRARWILPAHVAVALVLCAATLPPLVRLHLAGRLKAEASRIAVGRDEEVERAELLRRVDILERASALDAWDADARYEAARTRVRLVAEGAYPENAQDDARDAIEKAQRELRDGRATSPLDPRPYYLGAVLSWRPDDTGNADRMMLLALRMAPAWHDVSFQVGRYFLKRWLDATRGKGTFGLLRWQEGAREPDELFARAASALSFAASSPGARGAVADLVLESGMSSREIDVALSPDAETELALARGLARRGNHEEACARYERALATGDLRPPLHSTHAAYARSLLSLGARRLDAALKQFDLALKTSPRGEAAETIRALASVPVGRAAAGRIAEYWVSVREKMPDEPAVLLALARAELAAGSDEAGSARLLEYAAETDDAGAYAELARLALKRGDLERGAGLAAKAAQLAPDAASYHMMLADALARLGRHDAAAGSLGKVLLLQPRNLGAARSLAGIELGADRIPRAIEVWQRFIDAGGDAATAHEALADIYIGLLDRDRAARELEAALRARPGDERLRKKLEDVRSGRD
jgi:O-antigen ligase/tetratricopeptide (TPR) repeat protein